MGLEKAKLQNADTNETPFECLFNPSEYTISKASTWTPGASPGKSVPVLSYSGGDASTLQMQLFFDVSDHASGDVTTYVNRLWALATAAAGKSADSSTETVRSRPPIVSFMWGQNVLSAGQKMEFLAVITNLSVRYTLFREDGTPVRATADVTFRQVKQNEVQGTNPTSYVPEPGLKRRMVQPRDTLAGIAYDEYGDPGMWRKIAEANKIDDPESIRTGDLLAIPARK